MEWSEIASRNHLVDAIPVVDQALTEAGVGLHDIDAIMVAQGPLLVGALLVGLQIAKSLAFVYNKPLIPVHHLEGISARSLFTPQMNSHRVSLSTSLGTCCERRTHGHLQSG